MEMEKQLTCPPSGETQSVDVPVEIPSTCLTTTIEPSEPEQSEIKQTWTLEQVIFTDILVYLYNTIETNVFENVFFRHLSVYVLSEIIQG